MIQNSPLLLGLFRWNNGKASPERSYLPRDTKFTVIKLDNTC